MNHVFPIFSSWMRYLIFFYFEPYLTPQGLAICNKIYFEDSVWSHAAYLTPAFYFQEQSPLSVYNLLAGVSVVLEVLEVVTILHHIG